MDWRVTSNQPTVIIYSHPSFVTYMYNEGSEKKANNFFLLKPVFYLFYLFVLAKNVEQNKQTNKHRIYLRHVTLMLEHEIST